MQIMFGKIKMKFITVVFVLYNCCGVCPGEEEQEAVRIGKRSFADIVKAKSFVDKSSLIQTFFDYECVMVSAPKRFGKTTNMDMVRRFCEAETLRNGTMVERTTTDNYALFSTNNLSVYSAEKGSFFDRHFGRYPVIYMDFKFMTGTTYDDFIEHFAEIVTIEFKRHQYLALSEKLSPLEQAILKNYHRKIADNKIGKRELKLGLEFLAEVLSIHFGKRVVVLIDEYDFLMQEAIFYNGEDTVEAVYFLRKCITNLLQANEYVERALMNSCVRLSGAVSPDVTGIKHFAFTEDHPFRQFYGLAEEEVARLARRFNLHDEMANVRRWYRGYSVADSQEKLYSVFSVVSCMETKTFANYWAQSGHMANVDEVLMKQGVYEKLMPFLRTNFTEIISISRLSMKHIERLKDMFDVGGKSKLGADDVDLFIGFMLDLGYFTIAGKRKAEYSGIALNLTTPNDEVYAELRSQLFSLSFLQKKFDVTNEEIEAYMDAIRNLNDEKDSYESFTESMLELFSRKGMPTNDRQLKNALIAFPWHYREKFLRVDFEIGSGNSFIDLLIIRKDFTGIMIGLHSVQRSSTRVLGKVVDLAGTLYGDFGEYDLEVRTRIFIGLFLDKQGECCLSYLYNTTDIGEAVSMNKTLEQ